MFRLSMHSCVLTRRHSLYENVQLEHAKTNAQPDRQAGSQPAATHPPTHPAIGCSTGDLGLWGGASCRLQGMIPNHQHKPASFSDVVRQLLPEPRANCAT